MQPYKLTSFEICPFVQRSVITLLEKDVPYEIQYIDLADKPDWFLKISPFGKVPVLTLGDQVFFESAVINELIDETTPEPRLHPEDPYQRAHNRGWIEFLSSIIGSSHQMAVAEEEGKARAGAKTCHGQLERLEALLGEGTWFNGSKFSLVDAAAAPVLQRLTWCEDIEPSLSMFEGLPKVTAWRDALLARPSVKGSTVPNVAAIYIEFLKGGGSPARKAPASWLGKQAK